jgi:hypothetical protein
VLAPHGAQKVNAMAYEFTNQKQLRAAFWRDNPQLERKRIRDYSGNGRMHVTDTRVAWCDWLDAVQKNGQCSEELANRATLD